MDEVRLRIGHGVDAHRLVEGRPLMLGGVHVSHDRGLIGHSDGDCVAHALADALLAASGLGDIGRHFPSSDEAWRDVAGQSLLREVARIMSPVAQVVSGHVVIIAEEPRLATFTADMEAGVAAALSIEPGVIRITATSTDGLGFEGHAEGISASAVALVSLL